MDQRRFFLFIALSFAALMLNFVFMAKQFPPKKIEADAKNEQAADPPGEGAGVEVAPAVNAEAVEAKNDAAEQVAKGIDPPAEEETPLTFVTLGSVDPDGPFRGLFTFTNQGGAVRRVELANPRYRDLQDRGGYVGNLELISDPAGGMKVQSVGPGTPAADAGIEVGDRIVTITEKNEAVKLESVQQFAELLGRRKPGGKMTLSVARGEEKPRDVEVSLGRRPLEVIRPESENVLMRMKTLPEGFFEEPSFLMTMQSVGKEKIRPAKGEVPEAEEMDGVALRESFWEIADSSSSSVTFRKLVPKYKLEVLKRYKLESVPQDQLKDENYPGYGLTMDVEIRNLDSKPIDLAYRLDGPSGLPIEGWWYAKKSGQSSQGLRDVVGRYFGSERAEQSPTEIANGRGKDFEGGSMAFMGVDAQYFAAMIMPIKESPEDKWLEIVRPVSLSPKPKPRSREGLYANVTCRLISEVNLLDPDESLKHSYTVFTGPKRPELLSSYKSSADPKYTLNDLMYYGWFGGVARAMLAVLHTFYGFVGNYGLSIIMLTVLVRSCMFPLSRKQAQSMAKMQELKPELDKIKEKYKSDTAKQSQAMQELYRKYNINPLGGCLPMFIQLPIFVGLYRALSVDVELRQAPLISDSVRWCSNLAAPDMLINWSGFMPSFVTTGFLGLGPYLNVLPLVTIGLFILQQKMFMPPAANEQAAMQQNIMKYMMVFMGFMFYTVASGLCLYFIASSLWGIAERKLLPKPASATVPRANAKNGAPSGDLVRPKKKR